MQHRNWVRRRPGDFYLGHADDARRKVQRGFQIRGKRALMTLHPSFQYQPGIGLSPGGVFVDTLCLSWERYKDLEASVPGETLRYTAEGGMSMTTRRLKKHQKLNTRRNLALWRSARRHRYVQLWFGVPPTDKTGPSRGANVYTYYGLYKVSNWTQRVDPLTGYRYYTVDLDRKDDDENRVWLHHVIA